MNSFSRFALFKKLIDELNSFLFQNKNFWGCRLFVHHFNHLELIDYFYCVTVNDNDFNAWTITIICLTTKFWRFVVNTHYRWYIDCRLIEYIEKKRGRSDEIVAKASTMVIIFKRVHWFLFVFAFSCSLRGSRQQQKRRQRRRGKFSEVFESLSYVRHHFVYGK